MAFLTGILLDVHLGWYLANSNVACRSFHYPYIYI